MNDCESESSDQKECCKAAVEAYKQEVAQNEKLNEAQKSKWFVRGLAVILPIELVYLWHGDWNFINILFSVVALLCWACVVRDMFKWAINEHSPRGLR